MLLTGLSTTSWWILAEMCQDPTEINADELHTIEQDVLRITPSDDDGWEDEAMTNDSTEATNEATVTAALRELLDSR